MAAGGSIMADRQFTCPVPRPAEVPPSMLAVAIKWERLAQKWRGIAEQRSAHHIEMFYTGRWKHYYTDEEFLVAMRTAILLARRWSAIAPGSDDCGAAATLPAPLEQASTLPIPEAA
jgi:uncharacterized repeat protein (TIGR03809 family)